MTENQIDKANQVLAEAQQAAFDFDAADTPSTTSKPVVGETPTNDVTAPEPMKAEALKAEVAEADKATKSPKKKKSVVKESLQLEPHLELQQQLGEKPTAAPIVDETTARVAAAIERSRKAKKEFTAKKKSEELAKQKKAEQEQAKERVVQQAAEATPAPIDTPTETFTSVETPSPTETTTPIEEAAPIVTQTVAIEKAPEPKEVAASEPPSPTAVEAAPKEPAAAQATESVTVKVIPTENPESDTAAKKDDAPAAVQFSDLPLHQAVQEAIQKSGYTTPTPIQMEIIPHVVAGRDILAQSQTGTGKTAAFALPVLSNIADEGGKAKKPKVLVLAPTRELAIQVSRSFSNYGSCIPDFTVAAIYGGQDYDPQLRQLRRGVHVIVGTPGRVIDHIKRGTLDLSELECLVLDEADEMLNMGFLEDVEFVLEHTPEKCQVALFSATLPKPIRDISQRYLTDPAKVTIKRKTATAETIRQRAVFVTPRDRVDLLIRFLEAENADGVIVFTRTRETTTVVAEKLVRAGLSAFALNGEMPQRARERTIQRLKNRQLDIIVATDVAARGLDVERISHVFNFDLPDGSESYIHRVGRTGRAGRKGEAIIFLTNGQRHRLRLIERATKQPIEVVEAPTTGQINSMRVTKFKEKIGTTIESVELDLFKKMIGEYAENSGHSYEMIAAAIAHMGQNGRHFFMKDKPKRERDDRRKGRGDGEDRYERNGKGRGGRKDRFGGSPEAGMKRYRIAVGKRDGVRPGSIVGAIANEAGIDGGAIGNIQIFQSYSTVDLPEGDGERACNLLQDTRVCGRQIKLQEASDGDQRPPRHRKGRSNDRPRKPRTTRGSKFRSERSSESSGSGRPKRKGASAGPSSGKFKSKGKSGGSKSKFKGRGKKKAV